MKPYLLSLGSVLLFWVAPDVRCEDVNESLIVVGLPELANGWWLYEADSREVSQYWGGMERHSENPPGGLVYKAERDLNGDGVSETILRWTIVGDSWDVYHRDGSGYLKKIGSLGGAKTLQMGRSEDDSSWFRDYQFGPDRDARIHEYSVNRDLKISFSELGYYPVEKGEMSDEVQSRFENDKQRFLGTAVALQFKKALMLSLLHDLPDPWEDSAGAIGGSVHWSSPKMQSQLKSLEAQGKTQFTQARATLIQKLGDRFQPAVSKSEARLMSVSKEGEL